MGHTVAALYVETNGSYFGLPGVDPWDEPRDARLYAGPHPVVAHPPCQRWGQMAIVNYARYGGEHNKLGNDGGCFVAALNAVRAWGVEPQPSTCPCCKRRSSSHQRPSDRPLLAPLP